MHGTLRLILAFCIVGYLRAATIDWDAINGDPVGNHMRPFPPRRPANNAEPQHPQVWNSNPNSMNVEVKVVGGDNAPPSAAGVQHRPFEVVPFPQPPVFDGSQNKEVPPDVPPMVQFAVPPAATDVNPHHLEVVLQNPDNGHQYGHILVEAKPLDIVDNVVVPTPKYPERPQIEIFYAV